MEGGDYKAAFYVNNTGNSISASAINDGNWHCVAGIYGSGTSTVYVDGVAGTPSSGSYAGATGGTTYIGRPNGSGVINFSGLIAYTAVWYTQVLTPSDISNNCGVWAFNVIPELRPLNRPVWAYGATEERLMFYRRRLAA